MTSGRINQVAIFGFLCYAPQEHPSKSRTRWRCSSQVVLTSRSHLQLLIWPIPFVQARMDRTTTKGIQSPIQSTSGRTITQLSRSLPGNKPVSNFYLALQLHAQSEQWQVMMSFQHQSARKTWDMVVETATTTFLLDLLTCIATQSESIHQHSHCTSLTEVKAHTWGQLCRVPNKIWNRSPLVTRITKKQCCTIRGYRTIIHSRPKGFAGKSYIYCFIFSVLCDCISSKKLNARNLPEGRFHISLLRGIWDAGHHHVSATAEIRDVPTWKLTHDHFRHSLGPMIRRTWPPTHLCVGAQFFTTE